MKRLPPLHPGEMLREEFLVPLKLTPYALAKACGVPRTRIEHIVREEMGSALIRRCASPSFSATQSSSG